MFPELLGKMSMWLVVGISGVTCGGKSTLASGLCDFFNNIKGTTFLSSNIIVENVSIIRQDDYFLPEDDFRHQCIPQLCHINWEIPSAINFEKMIADIKNIVNNKFCSGIAKTDMGKKDTKVNILVVEGFLIFSHPALIEICQLKFHIHIPYEMCYSRRKIRVYNPPDVPGYFETCVWPTYEKCFGEFHNIGRVIFLNGGLSKEKLCNSALNNIFKFFLDI